MDRVLGGGGGGEIEGGGDARGQYCRLDAGFPHLLIVIGAFALEDDAEAGEQQHRGQKRGRGRDRAPARDEAVERRHDFCLTLSAIPRRRELMERRLRAAAAASTWKPTRPSARVKWIMPRAEPSCASVPVSTGIPRRD